MKYNIILPALFLFISMGMSSCLKDECTETKTFTQYLPVYRTVEQINEPITVEGPRSLENPGIIYVYGKYIFINEYRQGIHVINNENPDNPVAEAFYNIEGNEHFVVIDNQLQANKFTDLVTIDISNPKVPEEKGRVHNVFPAFGEDASRGTLVYYAPTENTVELNCSDPNFNSSWWRGNKGVFFAASDGRFEYSGGGPSGIGGSMARFTLAADHLYTVSQSELKVFDVSDPCRPAQVNTIQLGWDIETIYPLKDRLFIGSSSGMFIYGIKDPALPQFLSSFSHARACDPVVANDNNAFVTLRSGNDRCDGFANQMDVLDVTNLAQPRLIRTYPMINPHGLSLRGDRVYLCEGEHGLKILDVSDPSNVKELYHMKNIKAFDAISLSDKLLLVIGDDGLYEVDPTVPKVISVLPIQKL